MKKLIFILTLVLTVIVFAQAPGGRRSGPGRRPARLGTPLPVSVQLTEAQQAELSELIEEMRAAEASREDIHNAVTELLLSWGIELPERGEFPFGQRPGMRPDSVLVALTDAQRAELHELVRGLIDDKTSPEDINTAVTELLTGWGIDLPEDWQFHFFPRGERRGIRDFESQLTREQRRIIRDTVREMREAGATREEIRAAVNTLLEEFGIVLPGDDDDGDSAAIEKSENITQLSNKPNPFNPDTHINFTLNRAGHVRLSIYNIQGQLVRNLVDEYKDAGNYSIYWNGLDQSGRRAVSGMYIYQITVGNKSVSKQMIMMK